ncbi:MAG: MarR family transcriptional protein [Chloroflexi bacterium]|nr:MAG: MarR family transcriptional protein [Chloroflexota bacterium]
MKCGGNSQENKLQKMHAHLRQSLIEIGGGEDIRGIELSSMIRMLANFYDTAVAQNSEFGELSGPRMGILLRLIVEESAGNPNGLNPTTLSHYQNVKKNTISALIRGLEESGLIERSLDPLDKRVFVIRITKAGRELVRSTAPGRLKFMNELTSGLTNEEKTRLITLLEKLGQSIKCHSPFPLHPEVLPSDEQSPH